MRDQESPATLIFAKELEYFFKTGKPVTIELDPDLAFALLWQIQVSLASKNPPIPEEAARLKRFALDLQARMHLPAGIEAKVNEQWAVQPSSNNVSRARLGRRA